MEHGGDTSQTWGIPFFFQAHDQSNVPDAPGQASLVKNSEHQDNELDIVNSQTSPSSSNLNLT